MANMAQWAHFAMTWDGTNLRAFVNGVEKVAVPIAMLRTGMTALTIGGYPPAPAIAVPVATPPVPPLPPPDVPAVAPAVPGL